MNEFDNELEKLNGWTDIEWLCLTYQSLGLRICVLCGNNFHVDQLKIYNEIGTNKGVVIGILKELLALYDHRRIQSFPTNAKTMPCGEFTSPLKRQNSICKQHKN